MRASTFSPAILLIAGILGFLAVPTNAAAARPRTAPTPRLEWRFDTREDNAGTPHTSLFLLVNGHPHLIAANVEESFYTLDPETFATDGIPTAALTACQGWWAGGGDDYYVTRRANDLIVYSFAVDEQDTKPGAPRIAKRIPLIAHHRRRRPRSRRRLARPLTKNVHRIDLGGASHPVIRGSGNGSHPVIHGSGGGSTKFSPYTLIH